jgi:hypothetical protein
MSKIAIFSDSHDNIWNLESALQAANASGAQTLLHCGDLCAPFIIAQLAESFSGAIHVILGNNDGDGRLLQTLAAQHEQVTLHGIYTELDVADRRVAMIHYPEPAQRIAQSGQFDLVCYGHDHQKHSEQIGDCWLVNPGEIMGRLGGPGWGLYDCQSGSYAWQAIEPRAK